MKTTITAISSEIIVDRIADRVDFPNAISTPVATGNEPKTRAHIISRRAARWARRANH